MPERSGASSALSSGPSVNPAGDFALWRRSPVADDDLGKDRWIRTSPQLARFQLNFDAARTLPGSAGRRGIPAWAVPGASVLCVVYRFPLEFGKPRLFGSSCQRYERARRDGVMATFAFSDPSQGTFSLGVMPDDVRALAFGRQHVPVVSNSFSVPTENPMSLTMYRRDGTHIVHRLR